jgi:2-polyprenyl-6-methoxyphenol hydroxylase-like FAD-dependent oxidoreductase
MTEDLLEFAQRRSVGFSEKLRRMIDETPREHLQRWEIRDRPPLKQWSTGRVTLLGDAAHPTSPYAAHGAGMSIEDGYFLARELQAVEMSDTAAVKAALQRYEDRRKPHTEQASSMAVFFTIRRASCVPCVISCSTTHHFCRKSSVTPLLATSLSSLRKSTITLLGASTQC